MKKRFTFTYDGFEFQIQQGDTPTWVRLMGAGGEVGCGCLCVMNGAPRSSYIAKAKRHILRKARAQLRHEGFVRVVRGWDLPLDQRIEKVNADQIVGLRARTHPRGADPEIVRESE